MNFSLEKALRWCHSLYHSDKLGYEQGLGYLKDDQGRFCCLGVALNCINPNGWKRDESGDLEWGRDNGAFVIDDKEMINLFALPRSIQDELAGLNDHEIPFEIICGLLSEYYGFTEQQIKENRL